MNEEINPIPDSPPSAPEDKGETPTRPLEPVEKEIDLNLLFPDSEADLNALFPDEDIRHLLKSVTKNKKDLHSLKERFLQENETDEDEAEDSEEIESNDSRPETLADSDDNVK
ncbi:hypothetical protein MNBD_NITROSPINAE05-112 [hydrothermal vent metagenome]|uniref:Uncharacterized protein n=1 Tax=hydrothermal vent metagenome TaxID=652676 RepID=A0A3B1D8W2_9ZZZZ